MGSGEIQLNGEGCAFAFFAFEGDLSVVVQYNVLGVGQPQTGSPWFVGKIGFEDAGLGFVGDPGAVVCDEDYAFAVFGHGGQAECPTAGFHGFDGIDDDIEEGDLDSFHVDGNVADTVSI